MSTLIFIDGAEGTTGLEIRERLSQRSEFEIMTLPGELRKNAEARREALNDADVAILCLPDNAAREAVSLIGNDRTKVIDASTAHRVSDGWTYGFPELVGEDTVRAARRIANPGCYPTGFLAFIAPLVRLGMLPADWPYSINAVSGYSGGGKALIERFETDTNIAARNYALALGHKHIGEMQHYAHLTHAPLFAPTVIDAYRGMIVEVPLPIAAMPSPKPVRTSAADIYSALSEFYAGSKIMSVMPLDNTPDELLVHKDAKPFDGLNLHIFSSSCGTQIRLIAQLDNLGKGASGAAVQSLNLISGLPAETGLTLSA